MEMEFKIDLIGWDTDKVWGEHRKWRVTITNPENGRKFRTTFHTGSGIKDTPTKDQVLHSLAQDMEYCGYDGYFDFVRNMGFDYHDKDAQRIYRECQRIYDKWMKVFPEPLNTEEYYDD